MLHLDSSAHYGSQWASLTLDQLLAQAGFLRDLYAGNIATLDKGMIMLSTQIASQSTSEAPVPAGASDPIDNSLDEVPVGAPAATLQDAKLYRAADADLGNPKAYNIDLAPKVCSRSICLVARMRQQSGRCT